MTLSFQSLRSGSSGNCLMLWTDATRVLVDCGWESTRACRRGLRPVPAGAPADVSAVFVTHLHGDHLSLAALRALRDLQIPVYCHADCVAQVERMGVPVRLHAYDAAPISVGDLTLRPVRVRHTPRFLTHGFAVASAAGERLMLATDLASWDGLLEHFVPADFVFIEANHDPELARAHPVPNSRYHLANEQAAALIAALLRARGGPPPGGIMLGHISAERNRPELLRATIEAHLRREGLWDPALTLALAPRRASSARVTLGAAPPRAPGRPVQLALFGERGA